MTKAAAATNDTAPMAVGLPLMREHAPVFRRGVGILAAILAAAFLLRLGARMAAGEADFWSNSYATFYTAARHLFEGHGFCFGTRCSRPPIYVSFLALTIFGGHHYLLIVVPQAILGAGTALCAFLIGRHIFGGNVGLLAAAAIAVYPYYVMHDTALQDTGASTFALALAVWLVLRASRLDRAQDWLLAGLALGLAVLVRVSLASAAAAAVLWVALWGLDGPPRQRLRAATILALALAATLAPWLIYTARITGTPQLSSDVGFEFWVGNNPDTFSHYPAESIDKSSAQARRGFSAQDRATLRRLASDHVALGHWYFDRARAFLEANPSEILPRALRKIEAAFSWRLNPYRALPVQAAYVLGYGPVSVLGIAGMILAYRRRETPLIALLFTAFAAVTVVFSAETSHRAHLDVYWAVFAASVLERLRMRIYPAGTSPP
jgi:4-amino-4-deoxy-L-arabinose transferase-like glycosyltransferase